MAAWGRSLPLYRFALGGERETMNRALNDESSANDPSLFFASAAKSIDNRQAILRFSIL
jgi:hypothetical protein